MRLWSAAMERRACGFVVALIVLSALAAALRLPGLGHNPPGFFQDEASTGADALALFHSGRDRFGAFLPVIARSFGDYPITGYRWLAAPVVGLLGLTIAHERAVAAVAGTLLVALTGLLAAQLAGRRAAVAAMLSAALSPSWIFLSRYGSEMILMPLFATAGVWLIERGTATQRRPMLWLGAAALAASAYTYHAVKIFLPLLVVALLVRHHRLVVALWRTERRHVVGPVLLFALLVLPSLVAALSPEGMARGRTVMLWHHATGLSLAWRALRHVASYLDPRFLFVSAWRPDGQGLAGAGVWSVADLPFLVVGLTALARTPSRRRLLLFLGLWTLAGLLPGVLSFEGGNLGRATGALVPVPQIICGVGLATAGAWAWARRGEPAGRLTLGLFAAAWLLTAVHITWVTYVHHPAAAGAGWEPAINRALACAKSQRAARTVVVAPDLAEPIVVEAFVRFYFDEEGAGAAVIARRTRVGPAELYAFPAGGAMPEGRSVCTVALKAGAPPLAFVYEAPGP